MHTVDPAVLLFACGALQNLCYERDWAELAVSYDVQLRLETLLTHEDAMIVRYASGALQNITRALQLNADGLSEFAMAAIKERSLEHRREEWVQQRAISKLTHAIKEIPADLRQQRHENGRRRRQRSLQMDRNDPLVASRTSSRPSSAASSRSTSSFVSARSSMTSGSSAVPNGAPAALGSPLLGRTGGPSPGSDGGISEHSPWPAPPVSPLTYY